MPRKKFANPFYVSLLVVGALFGLTACAYGVMIVQMRSPELARQVQESESGLLYTLDQHGMLILGVELVVLALLTVAAMRTDDYFTNRPT